MSVCPRCFGSKREQNWIARTGHVILNQLRPWRDCTWCGGTGEDIRYEQRGLIPDDRALEVIDE